MADFREELAWIDGQKDRMIDMVMAWSRVNSGSHNLEGLAEMGSAASAAFSSLPVKTGMIETLSGRRVGKNGEVEPHPYGNVYQFSKKSNANRKVLLTGHLDTVFPKDSRFQAPKNIDENTLNGPGVADMKGGIIVMLVALEALSRSKVAKGLDFEVLLNSDEEIGSIGSVPILMERAKDFDFGMTFEPALPDGTLAGDRKGSGNFTVVVRGKSAHAGREFDKGINAIHGLAGFTLDLYALNGKKAGLTVNPAKLEGGGAPNIVPDLAIMTFNVRVHDKDQQTWFEENLQKLVRKHSSGGLKIEPHGYFTRPPKVLDKKNTKLFEVLKGYGAEIGVEVNWKPTGGCCDGNNLAAAGLANIDTLGVRGGKIHTDGEFALLDSFTERAKLSALLLLNYAAGNFSLGEG
ncbi:MAG: hydrolase [Alphaproteobacteria bacterium]